MKTFIISVILLTAFLPAALSQQEIDLLMLNKNYKEALQKIEQQLRLRPGADLYFKQGLIFSSLQDYQRALGAYSEALRYDPGNSAILAEMADGLSVLGNNREAIQYYKMALEHDPGNLVLAGKLGRTYINEKEYKNAYDVFSGIYSRDSTNMYWNKQLAYCAFRTFKRGQAVYLYEKVLEENPRDLGTYLNLLHAYDSRKEGGKVLDLIERGLNEFPGEPEFYLERAAYYFRNKMYEPAMHDFQSYFDNGGAPVYEIRMNYGISTYFAGAANEALEIFNNLNRENPNDGIVMYYQSLCYKKLKNFEESEKLMKWAIEASIPGYVADMYHHLGQIFGQQRKFKESVDALEKSYRMDPGNFEILFEIATTYEEFNSNKTLALNYYNIYLKEAGERGRNINYVLTRISRIKEELFFDE